MKDKDIQSEEFDARVERLLLGEHTEGSPEMAHRPTKEQLNESIRNWKPTIMFAPPALTEERVREIVREMFEQMIEPAAQRISERVKQMIESMDESE